MYEASLAKCEEPSRMSRYKNAHYVILHVFYTFEIFQRLKKKSIVPDVYKMEGRRGRVKQEDLLESKCKNPG